MELYVTIFLFPYFLFFLVFNDFVRCVDFTHIAVSNTASYDVTIGHIINIYCTDLINIFLFSFCNRKWWKI